MGRIFTVDFSFGGRVYTAFVKISAVSGDFSVHIHVPDTTLHHLIPEGNIIYHNGDGLTSLQQSTSPPAFELIDRIIGAVEMYLKEK